MVDYLLTTGQLKALKRTGWVRMKVRLPESVADHMYRLTAMSFCIQDPKLNRDHIAKLCAVHDIAEAVIGDIIPYRYSGVTKQDKFKQARFCFGAAAHR